MLYIFTVFFCITHYALHFANNSKILKIATHFVAYIGTTDNIHVLKNIQPWFITFLQYTYCMIRNVVTEGN